MRSRSPEDFEVRHVKPTYTVGKAAKYAVKCAKRKMRLKASSFKARRRWV